MGWHDPTPLRLKSAVLAVRDWYAANGMLLNSEKSSAILVSHHRKFLTANTCLVAGTIVPIKNTITALGATLWISGTAFVTAVVQQCLWDCSRATTTCGCFYICVLFLVTNYISLWPGQLVGPNWTNCNDSLTGFSHGDLNRLQLVQNRLARLATNTPRRARILPS